MLCTQYCALAVDLNQSIKAIYPLKSFLRRFYQHGHTELSPLHAQFFYLCLHAKCYFAAMEILNQCVSRCAVALIANGSILTVSVVGLLRTDPSLRSTRRRTS